MLFALGAEDAVDRVGRTARGLVVVANLHFSEEADGQHVESCEEKNGGEDHQRAVLDEEVGLVEELLLDQPSGDTESAEDAEHADSPEEVQRARQVAQQEADGDQVEEYAEGARDTVV